MSFRARPTAESRNLWGVTMRPKGVSNALPLAIRPLRLCGFATLRFFGRVARRLGDTEILEPVKRHPRAVPGRSAGADVAAVEDLHQIGPLDAVNPIVAFEPGMVVGKWVPTTPEGDQRRRVAPPVGTQTTRVRIVAQEAPGTTHLGFGRRLIDGIEPTMMDRIVGVHARHGLIVRPAPTSVPVILNDDLDPAQAVHLSRDVGGTVRGTEKKDGHFETAHTRNKEPSEEIEPSIEPPAIAVAMRVVRIPDPRDRKSGDNNVAHHRNSNPVASVPTAKTRSPTDQKDRVGDAGLVERAPQLGIGPTAETGLDPDTPPQDAGSEVRPAAKRERKQPVVDLDAPPFEVHITDRRTEHPPPPLGPRFEPSFALLSGRANREEKDKNAPKNDCTQHDSRFHDLGPHNVLLFGGEIHDHENRERAGSPIGRYCIASPAGTRG